MAKINPTRMNLINLRKSIKLADKGHDLLKRKREILVIEFLRMLQESRVDRAYLDDLLAGAYKSVAIASAYIGNFELQQESVYIEKNDVVEAGIKNIMGVKIPSISEAKELAKGLIYNPNLASADVSDSFMEVRNAVIEVAKREQALRKVVLEIDKVKRRVNALEYILIPNLKKQTRYIAMRLDEIDRDTFSGLKHVKKKLAKKQAETG